MTATSRSRRGWQAIGLALALIAFALVLAGIRSGVAAGEGTAQASRSATVSIVDFAFKPATVTIGAGSKVVFSNTSGRAHTATRKGSFSTGRIKAGKSASIRFAKRGTYAYHCTIHPFMHGKIVVD